MPTARGRCHEAAPARAGENARRWPSGAPEGGSAWLTLSVSLRTFSSERCLHSMSCATHSSISVAEDEAGKEAAIRRSRVGLCLVCLLLCSAVVMSLRSSVGRGAGKVGRCRPHSARGAGADGPGRFCSRLVGHGQSLGPLVASPRRDAATCPPYGLPCKLRGGGVERAGGRTRAPGGEVSQKAPWRA